MSLVVCNEGEVDVLEALVNKTAPQNLVLRLFKSNTTPAETDTAATYTEATFSGYAAQTLTGADWNAASAGAPSSIDTAAQRTFTCTGAATDDIYGYYMTQVTSGDLIIAERAAAAPFAVRVSGDAVKVTPAITCD